jgi:hypothetical protein
LAPLASPTLPPGTAPVVTASLILPATDSDPSPSTPSNLSPNRLPPYPTFEQIEVPVSDRGEAFHGPDPVMWLEPEPHTTSSGGGGAAATGHPGRHQVDPRLCVSGHWGSAVMWHRHQHLRSRRPQRTAPRRVGSSHRASSLGEPAKPLGLEHWWVLRICPPWAMGSCLA